MNRVAAQRFDDKGLSCIAAQRFDDKGLSCVLQKGVPGNSAESWIVSTTVCGTLRTIESVAKLDLLFIKRCIKDTGIQDQDGRANASNVASRGLHLLGTGTRMLKGNMLIHTTRVNDHYRKHELFRGSVIPHLEAASLPKSICYCCRSFKCCCFQRR
jgi:hypothetical protein